MKKQNTIRHGSLMVCLMLGATFLGACANESKEESSTGLKDGSESSLSSIILASEPTGAISVEAARQTAQPGQSIVVVGQIGAVDKPFGEAFATLTLADESIQFCDEMEDDHCPMPWDACCEDPEKVAQGRASVQVLEKGRNVKGSLKGVGRLKELDRIVVQGVVDEASTPENLIINASGIYRAQM